MITFKNIELQRMEVPSKGKVKYLINGKEYFVEEAAIHHYGNLGYHAIWSENSYWWTLMSLLFWDVIFAKIQGAVVAERYGSIREISPNEEDFDFLFQNMIQMNGMPQDFFTTEFYLKRAKLIENRIRELSHCDIQRTLIDSYNNNFGKRCRLIEDWNKFSLKELMIPINRFPKNNFLRILRRIIVNVTENRSGLPDLIVFNQKDFFFVEVKSERDKISNNQIEWHDFLSKVVGANVEVLLINSSSRRINNMKKKYNPGSKKITISFGHTSSNKREDAIELLKKQNDYFSHGEGRNATYGANFIINEENIDDIFNLLDLTRTWKSSKIEQKNEVVEAKYIRAGIKCVREKKENHASLDWCRRKTYDSSINIFGCKKIKFEEIERNFWTNYGYIDTNRGLWIFDQKKIVENFENKIGNLQYCPLFDEDRVRKILKKIPKSINPKTNRDWGFKDSNYSIWFWNRGAWMDKYGKSNFPGIKAMIGVEKITLIEKQEAIEYKKNENRYNKEIIIKVPTPKRKKKACFIATAVYGDVESYEVKLLRNYRDESLLKSPIGRLFIKFYYFFSPPIADFLKKHKSISREVKRFLDGIISIICHR